MPPACAQPRVRLRIMKVLKPYSATCHQKYSVVAERLDLGDEALKSPFLAEISAHNSFVAFRHASMISLRNGRNCAPAAISLRRRRD